jgi:RNA polymerase sigma factor (sigma-70 family)
VILRRLGIANPSGRRNLTPMVSPADQLSAALEATLDRFGRMVRSVGRHHGLNETDLDEVLQDVRIRLWRALETGERVESANTSYIYRTAWSAAHDLLRSRRTARQEKPLEAVERKGSMITASPAAPDAMVQSADLSALIFRLVDQLRDPRRLVVRMYLTGYRPEEMSRVLGWSEAKTRNLVYRGLGDLRSKLAEQGIGPESAA